METCSGVVDSDTGACEPCASNYENNPETPVWDENAQKCVPCPNDRPNWDPEAQKCMPPCPPEKPVWTNGEFWEGYATCAGCAAVTGGAAPFWDPENEECVKTCPEAAPAEGSATCRSCAEADARYPLWNANTQECVAKCPEITEGDECRRADEVDPEKPYWDKTDNRTKSCSDVSAATPYWEPNARLCVARCSDGATSSNVCRTCTDGEFWTGERCASCPGWLPNWDESLRKCVSACSDRAQVYYEGGCLTCAEYSKLDGNTANYYLSGVGCVAVCPEGYPVADSNNVCRSCAAANPERPSWDGSSCVSCGVGEFFDGEECVSDCPAHIPFADKFRICWACAQVDERTPYWEEDSCKACSEGLFWDSGSQKCVQACQESQFVSIYSSACVDACGKFEIASNGRCACSAGLSFDFERRECVLPADSVWEDFTNVCAGAGLVVSLDGRSCEAGCGEHAKEVDGRCACKADSVLSADGNSCVLRRECEADGRYEVVGAGEFGVCAEKACVGYWR